MKWRNRIAQGFYEADLVKSVAAKKFSYVFEFFGLNQTTTQLRLALWCLIEAVRGTSTVMIKDQKSVRL